MARYPEAFWNPAGATPGGAITPRVVIVHSEATRGDARPHSGLEWHFWVAFSGKVVQLVDTARRADANHKANAFAVSVETEDDGDPDREPWTEPQLASLARLIRWCCDTHSIPRRQCDRWDGTGIGYHTMWGAPSPWTPVAKTCPGRARIAQWPRLLDMVAGGAQAVAPPPEPPVEEVDDMDPVLAALQRQQTAEQLINGWYLELTGRGPDEKGRRAFLARLLRGDDPEKVRQSIADSSEARRHEEAKAAGGYRRGE